MSGLDDMAVVDLGDGKGPRLIPGLSWNPVSRLFEATMEDPHAPGGAVVMFLGAFETPRRALEALESMKATFARVAVYPGTKVGGPKPLAGEFGGNF